MTPVMDAVACQRWLIDLLRPASRPDLPWPELVAAEDRLAGHIDSCVFALLAGRPVPLRSDPPWETYLWNQRVFAATRLVRAAVLPRTPVRTRNWEPHRYWLLVDWWHKAAREEWATRGGTAPGTADNTTTTLP